MDTPNSETKFQYKLPAFEKYYCTNYVKKKLKMYLNTTEDEKQDMYF